MTHAERKSCPQCGNTLTKTKPSQHGETGFKYCEVCRETYTWDVFIEGDNPTYADKSIKQQGRTPIEVKCVVCGKIFYHPYIVQTCRDNDNKCFGVLVSRNSGKYKIESAMRIYIPERES